MPKEPTEPVVEVEKDEEDLSKESQEKVEIPLETVSDTAKEEQLATKIRQELETLYGGRLSHVENQLRGSWRVNEKLQKEAQELREKVASGVTETPVQTEDELDLLVKKGDWKTAVAKIAQAQAQTLYQQQVAVEQQQRELRIQQENLEKAKVTAIQTHPELDPETGDPDHPFSVAFEQELNADPRLLRSEYGPLIAMQRAEERVNPTAAELRALPANAEVVRRTRVNASSIPASRSGVDSNKVIVSREQKEFIDFHGVDPATYATVQKSLENGEGVTV